jgi:hypothetical protein
LQIETVIDPGVSGTPRLRNLRRPLEIAFGAPVQADASADIKALEERELFGLRSPVFALKSNKAVALFWGLTT